MTARLPIPDPSCPLSSRREAEIRLVLAEMQQDVLDGAHPAEYFALRDMLAEVERLRAQVAVGNPHTPQLCGCGHSNLAHTVPAPHSCFAYGQTCPCRRYRQLPHDEAVAQLDRNRRAAGERALLATTDVHDTTTPEEAP